MSNDPTSRYHEAAHAMQTGVAFEIETLGANGAGADPKHLRVGVNTAHADLGSLARLLIAKGVITEAEYLEATADGMEQEREAYAARVQSRLGPHVKLA
jgi:hypothetical protein